MQIKMRMPMKLKMSVYTAGSDYLLSPGDITDRFPEAEALRLIARGYATLVEGEPERAVKVRSAAESRGTVIPVDIAPTVKAVIDSGVNTLVGKQPAPKGKRR